MSFIAQDRARGQTAFTTPPLLRRYVIAEALAPLATSAGASPSGWPGACLWDRTYSAIGFLRLVEAESARPLPATGFSRICSWRSSPGDDRLSLRVFVHQRRSEPWPTTRYPRRPRTAAAQASLPAKQALGVEKVQSDRSERSPGIVLVGLPISWADTRPQALDHPQDGATDVRTDRQPRPAVSPHGFRRALLEETPCGGGRARRTRRPPAREAPNEKRSSAKAKARETITVSINRHGFRHAAA